MSTELGPLAVAVHAVIDAAAAKHKRPYQLATEQMTQGDRRHSIVKLSSPRPQTAMLRVHVTDGVPLLDVTLGETTPIELDLPTVDELDDSSRQQLEKFVEAIIQGRFSEVLRFRRDALVRAVGTIRTTSEPTVIRWTNLAHYRPLQRQRKEMRDYAAY